jgi:deazaflavin-dependent oxidoreductase (nitroreductase family)
MPLSPSIAAFNKKYTNRVARKIAPWLPGFGIVMHRGRTSGRSSSTPVNVFRRSGQWVFALTYGQGDWVQNVLHAGEAELVTRRNEHHLVNPRVERDSSRSAMPFGVRSILGVIDVDEFLWMEEAAR